jgi:hypothetical protein
MKGIKVKNMPSYWYNRMACHRDSKLLRVCANKKPYFMIYRYKNEYDKFKKYKEYNSLENLISCDQITDELLSKKNLTKYENKRLEWYYKKFPVGINSCSVNNICFYIESEIDKLKYSIIHNSNFDFTKLYSDCRCYDVHINNIKQLYDEYTKQSKNLENESESNIRKWYTDKAKEICPNNEERLKIIVNLCYSKNRKKSFMWNTVGNLICERLEKK